MSNAAPIDSHKEGHRIWLNMESGLSERMATALDELQTNHAQSPATSDLANAIDLSNAQNEVLRPELVEFCKTTIEDKLTGKVRGRQHAKNIY